MKVTMKLAKETREFINVAKRRTNIVNKQMINEKGQRPFIIYASGKQVGYRFTFSTEEILTTLLRKDNPPIVGFCLVDDEMFDLFEQQEYREITVDEYIEQTQQYIVNNMVTRTDARDIVYHVKKQQQAM